MSRKYFVFLVIVLLALSDGKKGPNKKKPKKGHLKGPFFENVNPRVHTRDTTISKEVDGRAPIDQDKTIRQLIFPGTKWCGQGNIATHYEDFGVYQTTDKCCRNHDYCPEYIPAGQTKYGLTNRAPYTKVHCDCDIEFKSCLKDDNSKASDEVGHLYFDYAGYQCFKMDFPIIGCTNYSEDVPKRCQVYVQDETQPPEWQFFDNPYY